jgi:uncharacterized protein
MSERDESQGGAERRDFLKLGAATALGWAAAGSARGAGLPPLPSNPRTAMAMPTRNLGRTGYTVGIFSLGGQASVELPNNEAVAVPIVERAIDLGVNYIDTARYGNGVSQKYIGQVMKRRRREVFLATKTRDRTRDGSLKLLEESLASLQTDHLDLWQIHNLSRMEEIEAIFAPDGAVKALVEAKEKGLVRNIGITGHADPEVLIEAIKRHPFDTILMALNAADRHHLSFSEKLLPLAVEKEMGIIGMKIPARGRILSSWKPGQGPFQAQASDAGPGKIDMREALRYVLSLPVSTVIIGCDNIAQVEENVAIARSFVPLSPAQMASIEERTTEIKKQALFFRRWPA